MNIFQDEISWMVSMSSPGFICGSLATRFMADRFGRRISLLGSVVPVAIGTVSLENFEINNNTFLFHQILISLYYIRTYQNNVI